MSDSPPFIPTEILEILVCENCSNYLSVFPIYIKNDGTAALCGRCKVVDETKCIRDEAYENIAQFLTFPCSYTNNGCKKNLIPMKLEEHELCCEFKKFDCPSISYSKCQWKGTRNNLLEHITQNHTNLLLKTTQFELIFNHSQEETYLMINNEELFVVKKEIDSRKGIFSCSIQHLMINENSNKFSYFLRLESGNKNYFFKCPEKSTCNDDKLNSTIITEDIIKERLQAPTSIIVNIQIFKSNVAGLVLDELEEKTTGLSKINKNGKINWDLLAELECPVCNGYMLPPIYQCIDGHSICESCKNDNKICPVCKKEIKGTRNFTLENMTNRINYPCKYHKFGCTYSSKATEIRVHENECEFGPYICPLKNSTNCKWQENHSKMMEHVETEHQDSILKNEKINIPFNKEKISHTVYLIKYNQHVFKFNYKFDGTNFKWCVQLVGVANVALNYRFEIDLIDLSNAKLRSYHMGLVVPFSKTGDCFENSEKYIFAPLEQIKSFVTDTISFRVRVNKV